MVYQLQNAFISYGRADSKTFALMLHKRLTAAGFEVWLDFDDIPLGVDYQNQINDGIEKADNFLYIISPHSINSPYCRKEIELALACNKRIIPLLHCEQITPAIWQQRNPQGSIADWEDYQAKGLHSSFPNMHPAIGKINWIYMREGVDDFEAGLAGLLEIFERHWDYVRHHTTFLAKALDWQRQQKQSRYLLIGEDRQQAETWLKIQFKTEQPPCIPTDLHCEFISESIKNANNLMTQVFIAHADTDDAIAEQIRRSLMRHGLTTWINKVDIQTGLVFQQAIQRGIEEADNIIYVLSPDSLQSDYCHQEIQYALSLNKRIIPILVRSIEADQIPPELANLQYIDLTDNTIEADYDYVESQLIRSLCQDSTYYEAHKILLVKALKWERQNRNPSLLLRGYNLRHAETWFKVAQTNPYYRPIALQETFISESLRQPPIGSLDVFISYSRTDSDFARQLNDALQIQGKTTWFDQESIASGSDFQREIHRGIESADHFLFIVSPSSINSPYCADEVEYAAKLNKRIITVLHRPIRLAELHPELAKVQWIDFNRQAGEFGVHFRELIRTLDTDSEHLQTHTKLLLRAIEWDSAGRKESLLLREDALEAAEQWLTERQNKTPQPTELHETYIHTGRSAADSQQRATQILQDAATKGKQRILIGTIVMTIGLGVAGMAGITAYQAWQQAQQAETAQKLAQLGTRLEREGNNLLQQFNSQQLDALANAIYTGQELQNNTQNLPLDRYPAFSPIFALQTILDRIREVNRIPAHPGHQVLAVQFLADGPPLLTIGDDRSLREWTIDGQSQAKRELGTADLWSASISRDGQGIATIAQDGLLSLWNRTGQRLKQWKITSGDFASVHFSPDGNQLATLTQTGQLQIWNRQGQRISQRKLQGTNFTWDPQGKSLASVDAAGVVRLWRQDGSLERSFKTQQAAILTVQFSPDGQRLATGDREGVVRIWTLTGQQLDELKTQQAFVLSLSWSSDGQQLATADADGNVRLWRLSMPKGSGFSTQQPQVVNLQFGAEGQLWTAAGTETIQAWSLSGKPIATLALPAQTVIAFRFSPDNKTLAILTLDGKAQFLDRQGKATAPPFQAHQGDGSSLHFSPDGQSLLTTGTDGVARLWTLQGQKQLELKVPDLAGKPQAVHSAGFRSDRILTVSEDGVVRFWARSGQLLGSLNAHPGKVVWAIAVSPDGQRFATASEDGTVRLWSMTQNLLAEFRGFPSKILSLQFSPDGQQIAAGGADGTVRWIPVESLGELLDRGCRWIQPYLRNPSLAPTMRQQLSRCNSFG
ncbi:TIR domain-containing protein [Alkalinema sp. FACHB-956]|uniref:toll/interleukin-1 receptor domain-containing protein n=1 Tax=Alkalinema sp. FACHB-956 TaxID=2692768 RepID=UPI00168421D7|nr:TIR domain-containing protein [Alkalinema sp. FACHB-956]MBD2328184.1 TIR domain-containing protein [Alkalinema sp. FACHB-956]